ncbi:uncharacterized protein LOC121405547 [Drosophila obscura]|uniref:uncharacterized protein LOC121405547 n=1 Tax=Drosophila obscura TaxID=7282 RepID=UPI001BB24F42|nr:uncharacterized protein LOC121405547 [Drosophila obscura]
MYQKSSPIVVLALCLSVALAARLQAPPHKPQAHIQELKAENQVLASAHSQGSNLCFNKYLPVLDTINAAYETDFVACISTYENATVAVHAKYTSDFEEIVNKSESSCSNLHACQYWSYSTLPIEDVLSGLDCANTVAADDAKTFYSISNTATELAAKIQADYLTIESTKDLCLVDAERNYVEATTTTYEQLNACLRGDIAVEKTSTTTTCEPTTSTKQPAIITTDDA